MRFRLATWLLWHAPLKCLDAGWRGSVSRRVVLWCDEQILPRLEDRLP